MIEYKIKTIYSMKVNSWTEWGKLKTIVIGIADEACFQPEEPGFKGRINNKLIREEIPWPIGKKKQSVIDKANAQLNNLASILEGLGVNVLRPNTIDFSKAIKTPSWQVSNMFCCTCPRDVMITLGNTIIEATMSKRGRFFEYLPYRDILYKLWDSDKNMKWKAAPKPSMDDHMYDQAYWSKFDQFESKTKQEQELLLHDYRYILTEKEIAFDAADIMRCGRDIFVQHSMTTNLRSIEWIKREVGNLVRVHVLNFPYDKEPSHIDCTLIPLRPPKKGQRGVVLTNPERPLLAKDVNIFSDNNWDLIEAPMPSEINHPMPSFCLSSKWLSMNVLSIDETTIIAEENEIELHKVLEKLNFKVIKIPYRNVFEFGGSIHCSTWDIEREDQNNDFFPVQ